jgi:hypothetical protein
MFLPFFIYFFLFSFILHSLHISGHNNRGGILRMSNTKTTGWRLSQSRIYFFRAVRAWTRFAGSVAWQLGPSGHAVRRSLSFVGVWINAVVNSWTWSPCEIFSEMSD